jgi:3',5'-cyclic-nucleotide phosphodiesterase
MVAERWTHLLQQEFASQGEMENQVGMETTLFGGPPEIGNVMKLANGQIGFMGIFAHPLFANVTDVIPAMGFAAAEITSNKSVWIMRIEQEKRKQQLRSESSFNDGAVSPRSQSPAPRKLERLQTANSASTGYFPTSPLRHASNPPSPHQQKIKGSCDSSIISMSQLVTTEESSRDKPEAPSWKLPFGENGTATAPNVLSTPQEVTPTSSGVFPSTKPQMEAQRPEVQTRKSSNAVPRSLQLNGVSGSYSESMTTSTTTTTASSEHGGDDEKRRSELRKSDYTTASVPLMYDDSVPDLPNQQVLPEKESPNVERSPKRDHIAAVSKYCPIPSRPQTQSQARNSGRLSLPSTTGRSSMATSGSQTHSTNLSTTLSPSTEATSFLNIESSDEQVEDRERDPWHPPKTRGPDYDRAMSSPSILPEVVPPNMMRRIPRDGGRTKSPIKTSTSITKNQARETSNSWEEGDGDKSMRRRISRLRFWRKKTDEDER